ncbi:protein phosphatase regulator [Coemansia sp. RSA 1722]|nr:protein phosphatase regulator [Coemansia sp. RSA 485]KAJ2588607.1 protein phosphatase regulator [Coemansia sp. RSA 1722]
MSDSAKQDELIQNWLAVNPGTETQARFYLEANNWDLNAALSSFYEQPPLSEGLPATNHGDAALPLDPNLVASTSPGANLPSAAPVMSAGPAVDASVVPPVPTTPSASVPRRRYGSGARIATLSSMGNNEDNSQEWYAGGEHSGMAVKPPVKDGGGDGGEGGSLVDQIMRRAAEGSAAASSGMDADGPRSEEKKPSYFTGHGKALGSASDPAPPTSKKASTHASGQSTSSDAQGQAEDENEIAIRELTFWSNGFSIGDGPLHNIEDPVNRQNLDAILQGRAPLDVLNVRPGQQVEMKVIDRRGEDFAPPAQPPAQPFSGQGRRLGGVSPTAPATAADAAASTVSGRDIVLDPEQRTVQVQIRLADGSRLVVKANPSHTVGDLRAYVLSQRPESGSRPFAFKTMMPPKVLSDDSVTIEQAGIANAAIAQHFI